jgi:hypothetical protein
MIHCNRSAGRAAVAFGDTLGSHSFLIAVCAIWDIRQFYLFIMHILTGSRTSGYAPLMRSPLASEGMRLTDFYAEASARRDARIS